ncbi:MAG: hypothetical protein WAV41_05270 [Microgenomates group bacterium]
MDYEIPDNIQISALYLLSAERDLDIASSPDSPATVALVRLNDALDKIKMAFVVDKNLATNHRGNLVKLNIFRKY